MRLDIQKILIHFYSYPSTFEFHNFMENFADLLIAKTTKKKQLKLSEHGAYYHTDTSTAPQTLSGKGQ